MHILYIHQYFRTPQAGGKIRSWYIARAMVEAGHTVSMICAHNEPDYRYEEIDGIRVHYLPVYYANALPYGARNRAFLRFIRLARKKIKQLLRKESFELVYATSTPLTVGLLALYLKRFYKLPYVFEVRDLWPEAPVQVGAIRNRTFIGLLKSLEARIYRKAEHVVAVSPGIAAGIQEAYPEAKPVTIPNMADCRFFSPEPDTELRQRLRLKYSFVVGYFGAAGMANHLEYLLEAAEACRHLPVQFIIEAEGAELESLQKKAVKLKNIHWKPYGSKESVRRWLSVCDAAYVSFADYPVLETCSPNKFFDGLAAGKLMIVNVKGWLQELVEQHVCGFYADPKEPQTFALQLERFLSDPDLLRQYQTNARRLAEEEFSVEQLARKAVAVAEQTLTSSPADGN